MKWIAITIIILLFLVYSIGGERSNTIKSSDKPHITDTPKQGAREYTDILITETPAAAALVFIEVKIKGKQRPATILTKESSAGIQTYNRDEFTAIDGTEKGCSISIKNHVRTITGNCYLEEITAATDFYERE